VVAIHPTAIVERGAELDSTVTVGPFAVIGPQVRIGPETTIGPHAVIEGRTTIGARNRIFQFAALGAIPQDMKYQGESTELILGDDNQIREFTTLHIGTGGGGGITRLGNRNLVMATVHVAHDCQIGDGVILANGVALAGHVKIADQVICGGLSAVHQFARIGRHAFVSAGSMVSMDVPPFCTVQGDRAELIGLNTVGLTRHGFAPETITSLKAAYKTLFRSGLGLKEALEKARTDQKPACPEVDELLAFATASERGVTR
jgi:UDP-N-acetylglucosamine acyltransferase